MGILYERMLDRTAEPDYDEMAAYCGAAETYFRALNETLSDKHETQRRIRFPYGNTYGWGVKHERKKKHVCDVFAERDAVNLMIRLSNRQIASVYTDLSACGREACDHKYPCGDGGWLHYRIVSEEGLADALRLVAARLQK